MKFLFARIPLHAYNFSVFTGLISIRLKYYIEIGRRREKKKKKKKWLALDTHISLIDLDKVATSCTIISYINVWKWYYDKVSKN